MWLNRGISSPRFSERYVGVTEPETSERYVGVGVIEQGFVFENPLVDEEQRREGDECSIGTENNVPNEARNSHKQSSWNDIVAPPDIESDVVFIVINIHCPKN